MLATPPRRSLLLDSICNDKCSGAGHGKMQGMQDAVVNGDLNSWLGCRNLCHFSWCAFRPCLVFNYEVYLHESFNLNCVLNGSIRETLLLSADYDLEGELIEKISQSEKIPIIVIRFLKMYTLMIYFLLFSLRGKMPK